MAEKRSFASVFDRENWPIVGLVIVVVLIRIYLRYRAERQRREAQPPSRARRNVDGLHVDSIFIYPVKSCAPIPLEAAQITKYGFRHDRRFLVVKAENGRFVHQRIFPNMALIKPTLLPSATHENPSELILDYPDQKQLRVPLGDKSGELLTVEVWDDKDLKGLDLGDEVADWLSSAIGRDVRLVDMQNDKFDRPVDKKFESSAGANQVSFADGYPFFFASTRSLNDLNRQQHADSLAEFVSENGVERASEFKSPPTIPMTRFRANFVVAGSTTPFEEDTWLRIRIGDALMDTPKLCARCKMTTVDPQTGKFAGKEPLNLLQQYRKDAGGGACFGVNALPHKRSEGVWVSVGDPVVVLKGDQKRALKALPSGGE